MQPVSVVPKDVHLVLDYIATNRLDLCLVAAAACDAEYPQLLIAQNILAMGTT